MYRISTEIALATAVMSNIPNPRVAMISFSAPPISSMIRASSPGRLTVACREARASSRLARAGLARVVLISAVAPVTAVLIEAMFDS